MAKALIYVLVLLLWIGLGSRNASSQPLLPPSTLRLHKIQLSVEGRQKRVSFRFSQPPAALKAFALSSPPRLVVDVSGPVTSLPAETYPAEDSLLARVRVGFHPQHMRFVLDLKTEKVPPFFVEQQDTLVTAVLGEEVGESGEVHSQVLFSLSEKTVASENVSGAPAPAPPAVPEVSFKEDLPAQTGSPEARHHLERGQILYDRGEVDEAVIQWREAVRLAPNVAKAHHLLGLALQDRGDLRAAIAAFQQALRLNPDNATAYVHLALALEAKGDAKEALAAYQRALQLVPTSPYVHNRLGHLLAAAGDWEGAVREWQRTTQLLPDYAYAYANLGEALEQRGKKGEALAAYERAILLDPQAPFAPEVRRRIVRLRASRS
jgi:Flp pilus assembly protein TadD